MNRRTFIQSSLLAMITSALSAQTHRRPRILLRSSWQTVNIGDIGHTPGVLHLLEKYLPNVDIRLWASDTRNGVKEMLQARFPNVPIVQSKLEVDASINECDFLLHGSGPYLVAERHVEQWRQKSNKPYGVFGITLPKITESVRNHLTNAKFVFFRDSVSLKYAKDHGVQCPIMEFGPDGAFAVDVRNDKAASDFLDEHGLKTGQFLCCIPRYRHTPYWRIKDRPLDKEKHQRNEEMKEHDHAPLRAAITAVTRQVGMKVLLCPEDQTQMAIGKEMILDKLPEDVRRHVVWRKQFWLTDEAVSTYVRSAGLFGLEMHSPIMCIGNGVPAVVCRFSEQTSKGIMWNDIGLDEWLIDMDQPKQVLRLIPSVLSMARTPGVAKAKAAKARKKVNDLHQRMVERIEKSLS